MARLVRIEGSGPIRIDPQEKPVWVCGCGLSKTMPLCDKSHKAACAAEKPGVLYVYDDSRTTVVEERPEA